MKLSRLPILIPPEIRSKMSGRSLWAVRYADGRIFQEGERDWSELPPKGRVAVRLYCPNGQVAELGNTQDATGRIFQLKVATTFHGTLAQVVGLITGTDGQCKVAAWEYGPKRLLTFEDNANAMRYEQIGQLSPDVLGITPD